MIHRCLPGLFLALVMTAPAVAATLLTSASNIRLRTAPESDAAVLRMLPLGTELETTNLQGVGNWVSVRVAGEDGEEGWINGTLTRIVSPQTWPQVVMQLIDERSSREMDNFQAWRELLELIESVQQRSWDAESAAGLELQRLKALQMALIASSRPPESRDVAVTAWRSGRSAQARYNEPGGSWLIRNEFVLAAHDAHRGTKAADEIAWLAVQNGLAGECEGYIVCYLSWTDQLQGEYLRRQPDGRHVEEAAQRILYFVGRGLQTDGIPNRYYFDPAQECAGMLMFTGALDEAVRNSQAPQRAEVSSKLGDLAALCR